MTSYLRNWLWSGTVSAEPTPGYQGSVPTVETTSPQLSDDETSDTGTETDAPNVRVVGDDEEDDDVAPAFPSLNSAQRASGSSSSSSNAPAVVVAAEEEQEEDDDVAPAFPSLNSAQRASSSRSSTTPSTSKSTRSLGTNINSLGTNPKAPRILTDSELMPPPPLPTLAVRTPGVSTASSSNRTTPLLIPPTRTSGGLGSSLSVPPSTTKAPPKPTKKREKVALAPGHSPLDWANLKSSGADLRGVDSLERITPSMLKRHNKKDDAWSAFYGKVYNITPYMDYHPGGVKDLLRVAGRDGTKLFAETHGWVNADMMLDACLVGFLVGEPSS